MYNIQQFKPALYVLLIMGLSGFAIAAQEPGLWALSVAAVLVQAGMVYRGRFKPISRLLSNGVCLVALAYMVVEFFDRSNPPVLVIGQFLVVLHLVTLFAQRTNRDYGVLLVLSVLLMVASGITTAFCSSSTFSCRSTAICYCISNVRRIGRSLRNRCRRIDSRLPICVRISVICRGRCASSSLSSPQCRVARRYSCFCFFPAGPAPAF